jgi:hypothetical protein
MNVMSAVWEEFILEFPGIKAHIHPIIRNFIGSFHQINCFMYFGLSFFFFIKQSLQNGDNQMHFPIIVTHDRKLVHIVVCFMVPYIFK